MPIPEPEDTERLPATADGATGKSRRSRLGSVLGLAVTAVRHAPGLSASLSRTEQELLRAETVLWREVRSRMEAATAAEDPTDPAGAGDDAARNMLAQLLTRSIEESAQEARSRLFVSLLEQLHPDEARILAALSDETAYPVVCIASRGVLGGTGPLLLENASTVGRAAGVALPDWVPAYVTHLQQLQLVSVGPELPELSDGYEILLTEAVVRQAQHDSGPRVRVLRRSVRLSPLGRELWAACAAPRPQLGSRPDVS